MNFNEERDLRGYVNEYGWGHSVAHTADALDELAMCNEIGKNELIYMLEIIRNKVCEGSCVYVHEEDEWLVTAIMNIIARNLVSESEIIDWIRSFSRKKDPNEYMKNYNKALNVKNFIRSLYFRMLRGNGNKKNLDVIIQELNSK